MRLKPFWCYYGGKYRLAPRYAAPVHDTIIEPFAGAAGYSTRYPDRNVHLYDADPVIAGLWAYLIRASAYEIASIPVGIESVDDLHAPQEVRWLVGFWMNKGTSRPSRRPSAWARKTAHYSQFWGPEIRERIATQVDRIRHWRVTCGTYQDAPDVEATWFIDPPYERGGSKYRCHSVDYAALGEWCRRRRGQVMVCEGAGAAWLPFRPFMSAQAMVGKGRAGVSHETLWMNAA